MEKIGGYPEKLIVKPKALVEQIVAADKQEQSRLLDRSIAEIQLFQVDRNYQLSDKAGNFSDNFFNFHQLVGDLKTAAHVKAEKNNDLNQIDSIYEGYLGEINKIYQNLPPYQLDEARSEDCFVARKSELTVVIDFIDSIVNEAKKEKPELFTDDWKNKEAGLLDYNLLEPATEGGYVHQPELVEALKKQGVSSFDDLLQIHFQPIFKQAGSGSRLTKIKESLAELAKLIVDKYPQVQGVTGTSWLLDNEAVCRLLGFKIIGQSQNENWGQLIDQFGQINQERLSELIKTGNLPMKNVIGYIGVVDFLKKFLPPEDRGQINLVKVDPEWAETNNDFQKNFRIEKKKLFELFTAGKIKSEADLRQQLEQLPTFQMALNQAGALDDFIKLLAKNNYQIEKLEKDASSEDEKRFSEKIGNYFDNKIQRKEISYQIEIN